MAEAPVIPQLSADPHVVRQILMPRLDSLAVRGMILLRPPGVPLLDEMALLAAPARTFGAQGRARRLYADGRHARQRGHRLCRRGDPAAALVLVRNACLALDEALPGPGYTLRQLLHLTGVNSRLQRTDRGQLQMC